MRMDPVQYLPKGHERERAREGVLAQLRAGKPRGGHTAKKAGKRSRLIKRALCLCDCLINLILKPGWNPRRMAFRYLATTREAPGAVPAGAVELLAKMRSQGRRLTALVSGEIQHLAQTRNLRGFALLVVTVQLFGQGRGLAG